MTTYTERERFLRTMRYQPVDRRPLNLVGPWQDTLARWQREGMPEGTDLDAYFGVQPLRVRNISGNMGPFPPFETRTLSEDDTFRVFLDGYGRTVRDFKTHTSMPEWLSFPVQSSDDLRRVLDEHYDPAYLTERFAGDWERKAREAAASDDVIMVDGGCYYWTLRSLAGVEYASYLFYDAPELVAELFRRYCAVVLEGIRRAGEIATIDVIGFGEDIGFKTGPLISPAMFRAFILPCYRQAMELAHALDVEFTWYDSDGDLRQLIPDYLSIGINNVSPCEVAAGMAPVELRRTFGRELRMVGGIDKREIAKGRAAIDAEFARLRPVIIEGGYVPAIDHSIPADVSWDDYQYFMEVLQAAIQL